tara:strand:+ start:2376 stop:2687 length:312 start_codon:yes stop_codon:yes gene_type:complete
MNKYQLKRLEEIMSDNKPRSVKGILDLMWDNIETENKKHCRRYGYKPIVAGRSAIPTKMQMSSYMSRSPDYDCAVFDIVNNRISKSSKKTTGGNEKRYWRIKQ